MGLSADDALAARLDELQRIVRDLKERVATLERLLDVRLEHPIDRDAVREKPVYDWQGPR